MARNTRKNPMTTQVRLGKDEWAAEDSMEAEVDLGITTWADEDVVAADAMPAEVRYHLAADPQDPHARADELVEAAQYADPWYRR